jgi:sulfite exporter TauE/SafE
MLTGLIFTAFLMGVGGIPHCSAMCGAACAAFLRKPLPLPALVGRLIGYAALGAVAAASASAVAHWARQSAVLQPLWLLAQLAALVLGVWLASTGRMPAQVDHWGRELYRGLQARIASADWLQKMPGLTVLIPLVAGLAWAALPCGLLYGAVMVAALANGPLEGALVMAAFALPSAVGLWATPWLLATAARAPAPVSGLSGTPVPVVWMMRPSLTTPLPEAQQDAKPAPVLSAWTRYGADPQWAVRLSGALLTAMSTWAIYHRLVEQWRIWCA